MSVDPDAVHDALESRYDEYHVKRTLSEGDDAVRLLVEIGHIETESMIQADFHQERFVTDETREVLFENYKGITETVPR